MNKLFAVLLQNLPVYVFIALFIYIFFYLPLKNRVEKTRIELSTLEEVDEMDDESFETWCISLLKRLDYRNFKIVPVIGDQGADFVATKNHERYAIKCKRHFTAVDAGAVEELYSAKKYYNCDAAIVMTNSTFTTDATDLANPICLTLFGIIIEVNPSQKLNASNNPMLVILDQLRSY